MFCKATIPFSTLRVLSEGCKAQFPRNLRQSTSPAQLVRIHLYDRNQTPAHLRLLAPARHYSVKPEHVPQAAAKGTIRDESTVATASPISDDPKVEVQKAAKKPGVRELVKQYGIPYVIWYSSLYVSTGVLFYVAIESGLLVSGADVLEWIRETGYFTSLVDQVNPKYGNIGVAFALNECFEVVRFPFALATTPAIIRAWKRYKETKQKSSESGSKSQ